MKKQRTKENDEARLKKNVQSKQTAGSGDTASGPAFRRLRKRLKRVQRKRRRLALRRAHAAGKKAAEGAQKA